MTVNEVNKIIAEYDLEISLFKFKPSHDYDYRTWHVNVFGFVAKWCDKKDNYIYKDYFSMDSLIPIWNKIGFYKLGGIVLEENYCQLTRRGFFGLEDTSLSSHVGNTLQEAAAYATAKAILKLKEDDD